MHGVCKDIKFCCYVFPTVNVPDHAHYTIGVVILAVGITGMLGNFLVIYAFSRSRSLRTPSNIFIINLAVTDFLMCVTQAPIFFITSMHKHWIFGKKGCELYAFCGALFGICSMMTLMVIAVDRYVVITRPLASLGVMSHKKALCFVAIAWVYSMGWSLPPFFGWSECNCIQRHKSLNCFFCSVENHLLQKLDIIWHQILRWHLLFVFYFGVLRFLGLDSFALSKFHKVGLSCKGM
ncbi:Melanopsin-A [Xenoophorus captivus]|uniref:Melanopsin-A n=1 Tax=Xenoophorus captivus TaxID=1517983 RepID=A0ABV0R0M0_9TELE